jgi:predicted RNA-binding Zn-ribbon protein involved in translation (DUF1610 family)
VQRRRKKKMMMTIVNLKCVSCGAELEITGEMERFACGYCGSQQIVERRGGTVGLKLAETVARIQEGTDKTAGELALVRLDKELAATRAQWRVSDERFRTQNKPEGDAMIYPLFLIVLAGGFGIGVLVTLVVGDGWAGLGLFLAMLVLFLGSVVGAAYGCSWALQENKKRQERHKQKIVEMAAPYAKHVQELEGQVARARRLVAS